MSALPDGQQESRPGRRRHRRLHGKAKRTERLTKQLTDQLAAHGSNAAQLSKLVGEVQPLLASLRRSALKSGGPDAQLVASGIDDLSTAFDKLARSKQATDPQAAIEHFLAGKRALDMATDKAREAGDAWPL